MSVRFVGNSDNAKGWMQFAVLGFSFGLIVLPPGGAQPAVAPGIDVWVREGLAPLAGKRVGLITNLTGRAANGRSTLEILAASRDLRLVAIFTPEHALEAALEGDIDDDVHEPTGLPIFSLYGATRKPTPEMLAGIEGLVFDIQDIGTRFYTYSTTLALSMEAAAEHGIPVVVLDRPNPIGGTAVSGPVLSPPRQSFVSYAPVPIRHGFTIGELGLFLNDELAIGADLTVIRARGWQRQMWYDATGLTWVNPSPNIRNLTQATLYPAVGPLEYTNLSVGRGTDAPFEWIGAPWMDGPAVAAALNDAGLPGVRFIPRELIPTASVFAGEPCEGFNLMLVDRDSFDAGLTAATLAVVLRRVHPDAWDATELPRLWGDAQILAQLQAGLPPGRIVASWTEPLARFRAKRQRYLLYR